jgi:hypothetical protein
VRKIKEVLRLKFEVGLGLRQIVRSCAIGLGTAHEYLQRAEAVKITWPLGPEWDDVRLESLPSDRQAYRKTMKIEKSAFPSASDVQSRNRRRLGPSMRIVPGTDCAALRYETKPPACAGGFCSYDRIQLTG